MFNTGSKKNNYHRRSNDKRSYSQNSKSYGDNSYRNMVPPTGSAKFDVDSTFKDRPVLLEGRSSEELKSWFFCI